MTYMKIIVSMNHDGKKLTILIMIVCLMSQNFFFLSSFSLTCKALCIELRDLRFESWLLAKKQLRS